MDIQDSAPVKSLDELALEYAALVEAMRDIAPHIIEKLGGTALTPETHELLVVSSQTAEAVGLQILTAAEVKVEPVKPAIVDQTLTEEALEKLSIDDTATAEALPEQIELDDLEQEILRFAQFNDYFRIEELHRGVPELEKMTKDEYDTFKAGFSKMRKRISTFLEQTTGESFVWATKSRNRGKRYQLVRACDIADLPEDVTVEIAHAEDTLSKTKAIPKTQPSQTAQDPQEHTQRAASVRPRERYYDRIARQSDQPTRPQVTPQESSRDISTREYIRAARFVGNLLSYFGAIEMEQTSSEGMKWTKMAEQLSEKLGIPIDEAKDVIRDLESASLLHEVGNHRGTRKLTTSTEVRDRFLAERREHPTTCIEKQEMDEQARVQILREKYGPKILDFLSTLSKHQTEFKTAIAAAVGDGLEVEDVNAICNLLASEGLVEPKAPKGRGTGRTRKGKTWGITGRGRNSISQDGRMTNAERQLIGKAFRA